tara:strand:- start:69571 stop:70524 length:954 start_codon:yes stop_codon:yes gene_type:complete
MSDIQFNSEEFLWVEKYRPQKIEDCILDSGTKKQFSQIVKTGKVPNMLLSGPPGTGKTTVARAMCNEIGMDYVIVNASEERGLDVIRDKVASFASTISMSGNGKCFILDEADHLMPATQAALRNASEAYSKSCSFIMTANYPNKIIPALHSRFTSVDFAPTPKESDGMQAKFYMRVLDILNNEGVEYDETVVATLVTKLFPDNRKILGALQSYADQGKIDEGILMKYADVEISNLIDYLRERKFKSVLQWCEQNKDNDLSRMYERLYKELKETIDKKSIPDMILILEDAQRYDAVVPSRELHLSALCTELMNSIEFK